MRVAIEVRRDFGPVDQPLIRTEGPLVIFWVSSIGVAAEKVPHCRAPEALLHVAGHHTRLAQQDFAIRTPLVVSLIIVLFLVLELRVLHNFLPTPSIEGLRMDGDICFLLYVELVRAEGVLVWVSNVG